MYRRKPQMNTKRMIGLVILSLMIFSVFIFREETSKLNNVQLFFGLIAFLIVGMAITVYSTKDEVNWFKDIPVSKLFYIIPSTIIIYSVTAITFAVFGMMSPFVWMASLAFIAFGAYLIYIAKQGISKGIAISPLFYRYDRKKNPKAFIIIIGMYIIAALIAIGLAIGAILRLLLNF